MKQFEVQQEAFSGPLPVLLGLLEEKQLEITQIALTHIADEFLRYLDTHEVPSDELADFLLVASRLIYLKTKELLPFLMVEEEEEGVVKLEDQLRLYQYFLQHADALYARVRSEVAMYHRPFVRKKATAVPAPASINVEQMRNLFQKILKKNEPFFLLRQKSMERVATVQEKMEQLRDVITSRAQFRFKDVLEGAKNRGEVIVSFLALLELLKQRIVRAKQEANHDIMIERI